MKEIVTDRLVIRRWKMDDAEDMFLYAKDPDVGPRAGWPYHETIDETKEILKRFVSDSHPYCFAICLKETLKPIGCIELMEKTDVTENDDELELGYWMGKPYWNKGYITEASKAVLAYGFNELKANIIWCGYYEGNLQSKRVQEKLGFEFRYKKDLHLSLLDKDVVGYTNKLTKEKWQLQK